MRKLLFLIFFFEGTMMYCQISSKYESVSSDYFPTKLYLRGDLSFFYVECLDENHLDSEYYEKGIYKVQSDTLYLFVNEVGFDCNKMTKEIIIKVAVISSSSDLYFTGENGSIYLKLSKMKVGRRETFFDCIK